VEDELVTLTTFSNTFKKIIEANPLDLPYGRFFWRLKQIDVGTIYPLVLFILNHPNHIENEVSGMFVDLESYLFRRLICGLTAKNYNHIFLQLIRDLSNSGFSRNTLQDSLLHMSGDATKWPDDTVFQASFTRRNTYMELKPIHRVTVVLKAIEDSLRNKKSEKILIQSPLTIEHIMPQNWEKTWPLSDGSFVKERIARIVEGIHNPEAAERDSLLHTFGNLTLLTQPLNSSISNGSWEGKRPEIWRRSALEINRILQDKQTWDTKAINERANILFDEAKDIWPYPVKLRED
jgi:hypothetical protein